ncbi:hypothetical protein GCM10022631_11590 [Deinococcus rubellus]|uniref:DUF1515 domain-containing protein n=1 Tax=Deinococcus rubellus TaxID=1889240 RepID=A0ABY5YF48_9DEIO|nr:hypothetical protein [Deinococcus rubellus]UWX62796.1 hypothetical protein N0D28_08415 [Deinococcus rubellus]
MTSPDDFQRLSADIGEVKKVLERLDRSVAGDPATGVPSIRETLNAAVKQVQGDIDKIKVDLAAVDDAASDRLDAIEQASRIQAARQEGQMLIIKWLGGGSLASLIAVIVTVLKFSGSHP